MSVEEATPRQRSGMRHAILCQTLGALSVQALQHGILLVYFKRMGLSGTVVLALLGLYTAGNFLLTTPSAYFADRWGKKRLGTIGTAVSGLGFVLFAAAGSLPHRVLLCATGLLLFSVGSSLFGGGWFALMSPIVPEGMRGRFWGRLRFTWQVVAIGFAALVALVLGQTAPVWQYQVTMLLLAGALFGRLVIYRLLPELETTTPPAGGFFRALVKVLRTPNYASFVCYCFLLLLSVAGAPVLLGLLEKEVLGFGDGTVVWLGNLTMIGAGVGFAVSGRPIDRFGTRPVFMGMHLLMAFVLFGALLRHWVPLPPQATLGCVHFLFGLAGAAVSVAMTTEMMALVPAQGRSLATSACMSLLHGGRAGSRLLPAGALHLGFLRGEWTALGATFSQYDALLLVASVAVLVLIVSLGLVPSVIGVGAQDPRSLE